MNNKDKLRIFTEIIKTLAWALSVLKKYRLRLLFYIAMLVFQSIYKIYMTSKIGNMVDLALADNIERLFRTGAFFALLYFINIGITIFSTRFASRNYNGMYNDLELKVYRKLMDASWEDLTDFHSGDIITRLSADIKTVAGNTSGLVPTVIAKLSLIFGAGFFIVYLDFSMIVLALVIAPVVIIASRLFMGKIYKSEAEIREIESKINTYNVETFHNIHAVKAFGLGDYFYKKMEEIEVRRKKIDLRTNRYIMSSYATSYFAGIIGASILIGWMFYRVHTGNITFGSLSVIAFLAMQTGLAAEAILDLVPVIMAYMASADRVKVLLSIPDEENSMEDPNNIQLLKKSESGISVHVEDMYFKYKNGYSVFEGASFRANPGELVAIVGASGEGKTTMLRILLGIVSGYKGRAYISNGEYEADLGFDTRSFISYVPQGNTMMAGTILDNLKLVNEEATDEQLNMALETVFMADYVNSLPNGVLFEIGQDGKGLSEGQNQRLAIARALLKDSRILLLDEATSALDINTERKLFNSIKSKYSDKTIIITTHRPTILSTCDRIYKISEKTIDILNQADANALINVF